MLLVVDVGNTDIVFGFYEDKTWKGLIVKRGDVITGRNSLSVNTGISARSVRTCLKRLQTTNEITIKSTNSFSFITIQNWESYQDQSTNNPTNEQPTDNQRITTTKNDKNKKNKNITINNNF